MLMLEVKGQDTQHGQTKREFLGEWVKAVNQHGGSTKWHWATDGGLSFTPNIQISAGTSNSHVSGNGIDYGDYSGLSFFGGVATAWSDNSNSTGDNPDGALHQLDIYTAAVRVPR